MGLIGRDASTAVSSPFIFAISSRNGNTFHGFADLAAWIAAHLRVESAVLDGEIACVDDSGRPVFRDLLFRRRQCVFIAFDLLYLNGKDLRMLPLIGRKALLKKLLRRKRSRISLPGSCRRRWPFAV
jgi:ATP-dependent DNA ligase